MARKNKLYETNSLLQRFAKIMAKDVKTKMQINYSKMTGNDLRMLAREMAK